MYMQKTKSDQVMNKVIMFNGKKLGGVQSLNLEYNIENAKTLVTVTMAIKRDSFKVSNEGEDGKQIVSFESPDFNGGE